MPETIWVLEIDGSVAVSGAEEIASAIIGIGEAIAQVVASAGDLSGLDEAIASVSSVATDAQAQIDGLTEAMAGMASTIAEDTSIIDGLNATIANLEAQIAALTGEFDGAEAGAGGLAAAMGALGEMADGVGAALDAAQGPLMLLSMAGVMAGKSLYDAGAKGQEGEALLRGMAGASQADIEALQGEALKLGENMDQASQGFYQVASAGYAGKDAIEVFDAASKLAEGGQAAQKDTMSALTAIMHDYNAGAGESTHYTDLMAEAVLRGKQSMSDFASSIGPLASAGENVGLSFEQVTAAEATMTQINPHVKQDTQQLASLFQFLSPTMGGVSKAAKTLGLSFNEQAYNSADLLGKLQILSDMAGGTNTAAFVKLTGGVRGSTAAIDLLKNGASSFKGNLDAMAHATGTTQTAFDQFENTVPAHMDKVGAAFSVFATRVMDAIGPKLIPLIDNVASAIGRMADFVSQHMDIVMPILAGIAVFFGVVIVAAIAAFVISFGTAAAIVAGVAAGIAVAVGVIIFAIEHWGGITDWLKGVWAGFLAWFNGILGDIKDKWAALEGFFRGLWAGIVAHSKTAWDDVSGAARQGGANLVSWWHGLAASFAQSPIGSSIIKTLQSEFAQIGPQLGQVGAQMRTQIGSAIAGIMPALDNLGKSFNVIWQQIMQLGQEIGGSFVGSWKILQGTFAALTPVFLQLGQMIGGSFISTWRLLQMTFEALAPVFAQIGALIGGQVMNALKVLGALIGGVILIAIAGLLGAIVGLAKGLAVFIQGVAMIITGFIQVWSGLFQIVSGIVALIIDLCTGNFSKLGADLGVIWNGIVTLFSGVWNIITGIFTAAILSVVTYVQGFVSTVVSFFTNLYNSLVGHSIIPDMINGIINWFEQLPGRAGSAIQSMISSVMGLLGGLVNDALTAGSNIVNGIATGIRNAIGAVSGAITDVTSFISSHLPHSPAKEGPLRDLVYQGGQITDQISEGMLSNLPKLQGVINQITKPISVGLAPTALTAQGGLAAPSGGIAGGPGGDQTLQVLLQQILAELQKQGRGGAGNLTMNNTFGSGPMNIQQLANTLQGIIGSQYESVQRGGY